MYLNEFMETEYSLESVEISCIGKKRGVGKKLHFVVK
jgi:hypothetical protein